MTPLPALLAEVVRSGRVESRHYGHLAVCDPDGRLLFGLGDPGEGVYLRSSAKPLQALTVVRLGAADRFSLSDEELAVICASHSGEPVHVEIVQRILQRAGLTPEALRCGPHAPVDADSAAALVRSGRSPERIHNNCSGKHAGMLAACVHCGWPTETYLDPAHPLQQENLATVARFSGLGVSEIGIGVDGCGVPTFFVPLEAAATAFARLAGCSARADCAGQVVPAVHRHDEAEDLAPPLTKEGMGGVADRSSFPPPADWMGAAARVLRAMAAHPHLVAGTGRLDTRLMTHFAGRVVSKGGAEGMLGMALPREKLGLAIKMADGNPRGLPAAALRVLEGLWGGKAIVPLSPQSTAEINPPLRNTRDEVIGEIRAAFDPPVADTPDPAHTR